MVYIVKPLMFTCPLFHCVNKNAKLMSVNTNTTQHLLSVFYKVETCDWPITNPLEAECLQHLSLMFTCSQRQKTKSGLFSLD